MKHSVQVKIVHVYILQEVLFGPLGFMPDCNWGMRSVRGSYEYPNN